ncbi:uncharacterized protein A4U43_C07F16830 [Asparagus officinalis]|uniref:Uncharacterized protein n=1 Tax=Asparagus officinalis TaxID=4686 RepID=A0A5P1EHQ4_ASPOF|nr:uncharacterized protein A4U43_C07F16830 [Asparagus officinalis]
MPVEDRLYGGRRGGSVGGPLEGAHWGEESVEWTKSEEDEAVGGWSLSRHVMIVKGLELSGHKLDFEIALLGTSWTQARL